MLSANRPRIGTIGNHQIQSSLIGCSIFCLNQMLSLRIISYDKLLSNKTGDFRAFCRKFFCRPLSLSPPASCKTFLLILYLSQILQPHTACLCCPGPLSRNTWTPAASCAVRQALRLFRAGFLRHPSALLNSNTIYYIRRQDMILPCSNITKSFGTDSVLEQVSFHIG